MGKSLFFEQLNKKIHKDIEMVTRSAAKALNATALKARNAVAKEEEKILQFKSKKFKKSIHIQKATKDKLEAVITWPDKASEVNHNGKTYLMIPLKKGLKNIGYSENQITRGLAVDLLKYAHENPKRRQRRVENPHAFFNITIPRTGQQTIAARKKENRKEMNWLYAGREGKEPDYESITQKIKDKHLEKDFTRIFNKELEKQEKG